MNIERVKELVEIIRKAREEITQIEESCPHKRILHKLEKDTVYGGTKGSKTCLECGKSLGCWNNPSIIEEREWTEVKE